MICDVHAKLHVRKKPRALFANGCSPAQRSAPVIRRLDFDGAVRSDDSPVTSPFLQARLFLAEDVCKFQSENTNCCEVLMKLFLNVKLVFKQRQGA